MKCDFCPDMARSGRLPYCAQGCPNKAIYYGDLEEDIATNGDEVVKLSRFLGCTSREWWCAHPFVAAVFSFQYSIRATE